MADSADSSAAPAEQTELLLADAAHCLSKFRHNEWLPFTFLLGHPDDREFRKQGEAIVAIVAQRLVDDDCNPSIFHAPALEGALVLFALARLGDIASPIVAAKLRKEAAR